MPDIEADHEKAERIEAAFCEIEQRRNPQFGDGPDELASDLWELQAIRERVGWKSTR